MQQRHGVQIEDGLGLRMVTQLGVVAGEAQNVVNAKHGGAQQVRLQGDAVALLIAECVSSHVVVYSEYAITEVTTFLNK